MEHKAKGGAAAADDDGQAKPASRISTMMPLLRRSVAVLIGLVAVMIALEDFGVNITPLIAGASVFGIAISFGSQTLVKDIVSGIFYLSDDAFRVGEYIDCGRPRARSRASLCGRSSCVTRTVRCIPCRSASSGRSRTSAATGSR